MDISMFKMDNGNYVPLQCCSFMNPPTSSGSKPDIDNVTLPCESEECGGDCNSCVIQKIMNDYAKLTTNSNMEVNMNNVTINGVVLSRDYDAPVRLNNGDLVIHYNKLGDVLGVYIVTSFRCTGTTKENTANHCSFVDMDNGYLKFEERCSRSTTMTRVLSHLNRGDYYGRQAVKEGQYIEVHKCGEYKLDVQIDKQ